MNLLTILEVGNLDLGGFLAIIFLIIGVVIFVFALMVAAITKAIYESGGKRKFSILQFWLTVLIVMILGAIISGSICGGM